MTVTVLNERVEKIIDENGKTKHKLYMQHMYYKDGDTYKKIDSRLQLKPIDGKTEWQFISDENSLSLGIRHDKKIHKYIGIRDGEDNQCEFTPIEYTTDKETYVYGESFQEIIQKEPTLIHHIIDDNHFLVTMNDTEGVRMAIAVTDTISFIRVKKKLDIKGFTITNPSITHEDGSVEYLPDEHGGFRLKSSYGKTLTIPIPTMWNEDWEPHRGIVHRLRLKDNEYVYTKETTADGNEWLMKQAGTVYIDAQSVYGSQTHLSTYNSITTLNVATSYIKGGVSSSKRTNLHFNFDRTYLVNLMKAVGQEVTNATFHVYPTSTGTNLSPSDPSSLQDTNNTSANEYGLMMSYTSLIGTTVGGDAYYEANSYLVSPSRYIINTSIYNKYLTYTFTPEMVEQFFFEPTTTSSLSLYIPYSYVSSSDTTKEWTLGVFGSAYSDSSKVPYLMVTLDSKGRIFTKNETTYLPFDENFFIRKTLPGGTFMIGNSGYPPVDSALPPEDFQLWYNHTTTTANQDAETDTNSVGTAVNASIVKGTFETTTEYILVVETSTSTATTKYEINIYAVNKSDLKVARKLLNVKSLISGMTSEVAAGGDTFGASYLHRFSGCTFNKANNRMTIAVVAENEGPNATSGIDSLHEGYIIQINTSTMTVSQSYLTHYSKKTGVSSGGITWARGYRLEGVFQIGENEFAWYSDIQTTTGATNTCWTTKLENPTTRATINSTTSDYYKYLTHITSDNNYAYFRTNINITSYNVGVARISSSGTFDTSFKSNSYSALTSNYGSATSYVFIDYVAPLYDGRVLVRGRFDLSAGGSAEFYMVLNSNGTMNTKIPIERDPNIYFPFNYPQMIQRSFAHSNGRFVVLTGDTSEAFHVIDTKYFSLVMRMDAPGSGDGFGIDSTGTKIIGVSSDMFMEIDLNTFEVRTSRDKVGLKTYSTKLQDVEYLARNTTSSGLVDTQYAYDTRGLQIYPTKRPIIKKGDLGITTVDVSTNARSHTLDYTVSFSESYKNTMRSRRILPNL